LEVGIIFLFLKNIFWLDRPNSPTTLTGQAARAADGRSVAGIQLLGQLSSPIVVVVLTARALLCADVCTIRRQQPVSEGTAVKTAA